MVVLILIDCDFYDHHKNAIGGEWLESLLFQKPLTLQLISKQSKTFERMRKSFGDGRDQVFVLIPLIGST